MPKFARKRKLSFKDKRKIKELKTERETALSKDDAKMAAIYRRRITRLKKKTRRAA